MRTYVVGGAVRDMLMGMEPKDFDYVVVGGTKQEMLDAGFSQVGADFPVFLHPISGDEYALARTERKSGAGYLGFETDYSKEVTIEDDLARRDLTINSIAWDRFNHEYIDPFGGRIDLENKVLRHTSEAFVEDPVRVLRIARFRARLGADWKVAPETHELIYRMAKKGVLSELNGERIWKEMSRALMEPHPRLFFDTLLECDALKATFPDLYKLKHTMECRFWHPEGDSFEHTMLVLTAAAKMGANLQQRVGALLHDIGKGATDPKDYPAHHGHDVTGARMVPGFAERYSVPSKIRDSAALVARYHMNMHRLGQMNPNTVEKMLKALGNHVEDLLVVGRADHRGRLGHEEASVDHMDLLLRYKEAFDSVKFADVFPDPDRQPKTGGQIGEGMRKARVRAIAQAKKEM
jgi:tRNA nucleotidyltransferase (CCA-adding enzyme)